MRKRNHETENEALLFEILINFLRHMHGDSVEYIVLMEHGTNWWPYTRQGSSRRRVSSNTLMLHVAYAPTRERVSVSEGRNGRGEPRSEREQKKKKTHRQGGLVFTGSLSQSVASGTVCNFYSLSTRYFFARFIARE